MAMDVKTAAFNVGHDFEGGVVALAPSIGKNANTLNAELAGIGSAKLGLADAVKMTVRAKDYRILDAFATVCGRMCIPLPEMLDVEGDDCMRALADSSREYSELVAATCASLADDGQFSANELLQLQTEAGQAIAAINALVAAATRRHQSGKPAA
jgi:hypothetical protein